MEKAVIEQVPVTSNRLVETTDQAPVIMEKTCPEHKGFAHMGTAELEEAWPQFRTTARSTGRPKPYPQFLVYEAAANKVPLCIAAALWTTLREAASGNGTMPIHEMNISNAIARTEDHSISQLAYSHDYWAPTQDVETNDLYRHPSLEGLARLILSIWRPRSSLIYYCRPRTLLTLPHYQKIGRMLIRHLAEQQAKNIEVTECDFTTWYMTQIEDDIQTEDDLLRTSYLIQDTINRMINEDRAIVVVRASEDPLRPEHRVLGPSRHGRAR